MRVLSSFRPLATGLFLFAAALAAAAVQAAPPTVEQFFQREKYGAVRISPSGRYLAVLTPWKDRRNVAVVDLEAKTTALASALEDSDAISVTWLTDQRMIVAYGDLRTGTGEAPRQSGVVALDRDGSAVRHLQNSFSRRRLILEETVPGSEEIYVSAPERSASSLDLYKLNTRTGSKELVSFDTPGDVSGWVLDFDLVPRAAMANNVREDWSAWYVRKDAKSPWVRVAKAPLGELESEPVMFLPDGKTLLVVSRENRDKRAVFEYDVTTGKMGDKPIVAHPERDVFPSFRYDLKKRELINLAYEDDVPSVVWFDKEHAGVQKAVDAALPDTRNGIQRADFGDRWVITASSDREPGSVYLLDGKTFKMEKLLDYAPWYKPAEMATTKWVRYKARDGLVIPALLTIPKGMEGKRVPLIVDIHGGPNVPATRWGFNRVAQFFATRGYATLAPQFRGTDGFGAKHFTSGFRKWGDEMQYDVADGVTWAVEQGIADKDRVCYYGASYGGYAAMWGAIQDKALIKCAVAYVGVSSIDYLFDNAQTDVAQMAEYSSGMRKRVGDPKTERERFKRVSPLNNADKVGVPILLAYGAEDRRVPLPHGTDFKSALDKHDKPYEWVVYDGEGHGWSKTKNVHDFYNRVDKFLATHLK